MEETTTCVRGFSHRRTYAMCRFAFAGALVLLGLPAARAEAAPIVFDFMVKFTGGTNSTLSGQSFEGSLSVDGADCTGIGGACEGQFVPGGVSQGVVMGDLLSLDITIDGIAFSLANASVVEPTVIFIDDTPSFFNAFWNSGNVFLSLFFITAYFDVGVPPQFGLSDAEGPIIFEGRQSAPGTVPEPTSLVLLTLGLVSACVTRGRQRRA